MEHAEEGQQHPIGLYLKIWGLLFVLSTMSYMVDYLEFQGYLRWFFNPPFHVPKGRVHRRDFHAHDLGKDSPEVRYFASAACATCADRAHVAGS